MSDQMNSATAANNLMVVLRGLQDYQEILELLEIMVKMEHLEPKDFPDMLFSSVIQSQPYALSVQPVLQENLVYPVNLDRLDLREAKVLWDLLDHLERSELLGRREKSVNRDDLEEMEVLVNEENQEYNILLDNVVHLDQLDKTERMERMDRMGMLVHLVCPVRMENLVLTVRWELLVKMESPDLMLDIVHAQKEMQESQEAMQRIITTTTGENETGEKENYEDDINYTTSLDDGRDVY
uniref:Ovule protein n=1 Tax=Heterorhabditis bacteriophora TaxID=37862 RepID=A0A1I7XJN5_HETBA